MTKFLVIYSKGQAALRGGSVDFEKQPGRHQLEIEASDKLIAYTRAVEHFQKLGLNTSVEAGPDGKNKLGFDTDQLDRLKEQGTALSTTPTTGVRIENIIRSI